MAEVQLAQAQLLEDDEELVHERVVRNLVWRLGAQGILDDLQRGDAVIELNADDELGAKHEDIASHFIAHFEKL